MPPVNHKTFGGLHYQTRPGSFQRHTLQQAWKIGYSDRAVQITMEQLSGQSSNKRAIVFTVTLMAKRAEVEKGKGGKSLLSSWRQSTVSSLLNKEMLLFLLLCPLWYLNILLHLHPPHPPQKKSQSACLDEHQGRSFLISTLSNANSVFTLLLLRITHWQTSK